MEDAGLPEEVQEYIGGLTAFLQRQMEELAAQTNDADRIEVETSRGRRRLSDAMREDSAASGELRLEYGDLATVRTREGYYTCDGSRGTPDLRGHYVRGAGARQNAGCTVAAATAPFLQFTGCGTTNVQYQDPTVDIIFRMKA
jgi:hypothetical protein